jgi:hypothetical protein
VANASDNYEVARAANITRPHDDSNRTNAERHKRQFTSVTRLFNI